MIENQETKIESINSDNFGPGSPTYTEGMYGFYKRARTQNVIGHMGASIFVAAMTFSIVGTVVALKYLVIHQILMAIVAYLSFSKWTNQRLDQHGLPKYVLVANGFAKLFLTSLFWFDFEASGSHEFCLAVLVVAYACAAGTMVTLGPLKRLARQDLVCMLLPGAIAAIYFGHTYIGLGTLFFLVVVAYAGIDEMHKAYCELVSLRAQSLNDTKVLNLSNKRLQSAVQSLRVEVVHRLKTEQKSIALQEDLIKASREIGKSEIATGVLHNVGNVMNSVTVSSAVMQDKLRKNLCERLGAAVSLLERHENDLAGFFTNDEKGKHFVPFLKQLNDQAQLILLEIEELQESVGHVNSVVAAQQSYATSSGMTSRVELSDVIERSLQIVSEQLRSHSIEVERVFDSGCVAVTDQPKLIQVLVNLFQNAKQAIQDFDPPVRSIVISLRREASSQFLITVTDTGSGITKENLERIFQHGFTTRVESGGHGFGLHHSFLSLREMGGNLKVESEGAGCGAKFTISLPCQLSELATSGGQE